MKDIICIFNSISYELAFLLQKKGTLLSLVATCPVTSCRKHIIYDCNQVVTILGQSTLLFAFFSKECEV